MLLSKTVVHGVYLLCYLSRQVRGTYAPTHEIAESRDVPVEHAHKILQCLRAAGLVRSASGRSGGHRLVRRLEEISMLELLDALAPPPDGYGLASRGCAVESDATCRVHGGLLNLHEDIRSLLAGRSVASVIRGQCRKEAMLTTAESARECDVVLPVLGPDRTVRDMSYVTSGVET